MVWIACPRLVLFTYMRCDDVAEQGFHAKPLVTSLGMAIEPNAPTLTHHEIIVQKEGEYDKVQPHDVQIHEETNKTP